MSHPKESLLAHLGAMVRVFGVVPQDPWAIASALSLRPTVLQDLLLDMISNGLVVETCGPMPWAQRLDAQIRAGGRGIAGLPYANDPGPLYGPTNDGIKAIGEVNK